MLYLLPAYEMHRMAQDLQAIQVIEVSTALVAVCFLQLVDAPKGLKVHKWWGQKD